MIPFKVPAPSDSWAQRWVTIIPRYSYSQEAEDPRSYRYSSLLVFEDRSSFEPLFQFILDPNESPILTKKSDGYEVVLTLPFGVHPNVQQHVPFKDGKRQLRLMGSDADLGSFMEATTGRYPELFSKGRWIYLDFEFIFE